MIIISSRIVSDFSFRRIAATKNRTAMPLRSAAVSLLTILSRVLTLDQQFQVTVQGDRDDQ